MKKLPEIVSETCTIDFNTLPSWYCIAMNSIMPNLYEPTNTTSEISHLTSVPRQCEGRDIDVGQDIVHTIDAFSLKD